MVGSRTEVIVKAARNLHRALRGWWGQQYGPRPTYMSLSIWESLSAAPCSDRSG
jgi:hypothetical protein